VRTIPSGIATVALNQMEELYIPHMYVMQNIFWFELHVPTLHIGTVDCEVGITTFDMAMFHPQVQPEPNRQG